MLGTNLLAGVALSASVVVGQAVWSPNQVSTSICSWGGLRAAVLHDTLYLDGGKLWWWPTYADGSTSPIPVDDNNPLGLVYTLNFSTPFKTTDNITALFDTITTGGGNLNPRAPNYEDGELLYNDSEFFLYGGTISPPGDNRSDPDPTKVLCYEGYKYGVDHTFNPSFVSKGLPEDVTQWLAFGGAASAPSENLAWYFSGNSAPKRGKIYSVYSNVEDTAPVRVSDTLITLDMGPGQSKEVFTNVTLPPTTPGRAGSELVWVPVGKRGILVAIGGAVYGDFASYSWESKNLSESAKTSPGFMATLDIYDVETRKWYRQKSTGGPSDALVRGCAVVAAAQDGSSFNIYYYGGYNGRNMEDPKVFTDDVWVLSLPSFIWTKLTSGDAKQARAAHKCVKPYPDQMFAIGGAAALTSEYKCLSETIRVYNMSSGEWLDRYDPAVWSEYTVPDAIVAKIGGRGTGGATVTKPSGSWDAKELEGIFATAYPTEKIKTYYPYASVGPINNTNPDAPPPPGSEGGNDGGGGLPSYLPPVLGVVLGLVFLTMVAVLILLWRRRRLLRRGGPMSEAGTEDTNGHRIASWLRGQANSPSGFKSPPTVTSSDYLPVSSPTPDPDSSVSAAQPASIAEMMGTGVPVAELPDTSPPAAELHSAALSPTSATAAGVTAAGASLNNSTNYSSTHQTDHASTPSQSQPPSHSAFPIPTPPPPMAQVESPIYYRPDSDALPRGVMTGSAATSPTNTNTNPTNTPVSPVPVAVQGAAGRDKFLSGISNLSERDRAHLRQISDTTISSLATAPGAGAGAAAAAGAAGAGTTSGTDNNIAARERVLSGVSMLSSATTSGPSGTTSNSGAPGGDPRVVSSLTEAAVVSPLTTTAAPGNGGHGPGHGLAQGPSSPLRRSVFSENLDSSSSGSGNGGGS
ncbi:hypothetical protein B0J18DRAFT_406123 [Chaetomium sp. MPI-SDFR-AT-0129]|nr:hypothetical protein B0J18DRAFT_406123 [Chaetomium sp. MPI-SDFR-AT-0129]